MSEAEAYLRIQAARLGRQFPLILQLFAQGALHLTAIKLLGPHLTSDNHVRVLEQARGKNKREIELLVAALAPKPDVPSQMRKLPELNPARVPTPRASSAPDTAPLLEPNPARVPTPRASSELGPAPLLEPNPARVPTPRASSALGTAPLLETNPARVPTPRASSALGQAVLPEPNPARVPTPRASSAPGTAPLPEARPSSAEATADGSDAQGMHAASHCQSPIASHAAPASPAPLAPQKLAAASTPATIPARTFALEAPRPAALLTPLRPSRYKLELTAGQALHDKLEQLKNLLRHQVPDGDLAKIVELAVDGLVEKTLKQRFAQKQKQKPAPRKQASVKPGARRRKLNSRYIPRAVVREVHERDGGQCTFESGDGKRCCERGFLELHHSIPFAKGGDATTANMKLLCRSHNALQAERDFGAAFIRSQRHRPRGPSRELP